MSSSIPILNVPLTRFIATYKCDNGTQFSSLVTDSNISFDGKLPDIPLKNINELISVTRFPKFGFTKTELENIISDISCLTSSMQNDLKNMDYESSIEDFFEYPEVDRIDKLAEYNEKNIRISSELNSIKRRVEDLLNMVQLNEKFSFSLEKSLDLKNE